MKLILFHKVLIAAAVIFCLGYGVFEIFKYVAPPEDETADLASAITGAAMLVGGLAGAVYFVYLLKRFPNDEPNPRPR